MADIKFNEEEEVTFENLEQFSYFWYDGCLYIKAITYDTDCLDIEEGKFNCFNISDETLDFMDAKIEVAPVTVTIEVKRKK